MTAIPQNWRLPNAKARITNDRCQVAGGKRQMPKGVWTLPNAKYRKENVACRVTNGACLMTTDEWPVPSAEFQVSKGER